MKKGIILLTLTLLAIPCITLDAARRIKNADSSQVNGNSFTNSDFKKVKRIDANAIAKVIAAAQEIEDANKKLAKLEELRKTATQSESVNDLILKDLALALGVFRGYTRYDDVFIAAQRNMIESLDNLVDRIQQAKASKITQQTFEALKDAVIAAIYKKADSLSRGDTVSKQKAPKEEEVLGWFANVFIMKPAAKPEAATEVTRPKKKKTTRRKSGGTTSKATSTRKSTRKRK